MTGTSDGAQVLGTGSGSTAGGDTVGESEDDGSLDKHPGGAGRGTKDGSETDKRKGEGSTEGHFETVGTGASGNNGEGKGTNSSEEEEEAKGSADGLKTGSRAGTSDASTSADAGRGDS